MASKKHIFLGQDCDLVIAVIGNVVSWMVHQFFPSALPCLLPRIAEEDTSPAENNSQTK